MKILYLVIFLFAVTVSKAQTYGNEWIDYTQQYFHFPVVKTGVQRINYTDLNTALSSNGILLSAINTNNFQVFGREKEVFINVVDGGDNTFDPGDYIEFYAQKNDGWIDSVLYDTPQSQPDQYYSLFNDTIQYYFTWNTMGNNKRFITETDVNYTAYTSANYCWKTNYISYSNQYNEGDKFDALSSPLYTAGEGWMSNYYGKYGTNASSVSTNNVYTGAGTPDAKIFTVAASGSASTTTNINGYNHAMRIMYGSGNTILLDTNFVNYKMIKKSFEIPSTNLESPVTTVRHSSYNIGQYTDVQRVSSVTITFPHTFDFENTDYFEFALPFNNLNAKTRVSITNFNSSNPRLLVLNGNTAKIIPLVNNAGIWEGLVPNLVNGDSAKCLLVDASNFSTISNVKIVLGYGYFRDFGAISPNNAYLIITNRQLWNGAINYAEYRGGLGGGHDTVLVDIEELYHQYGGGVYKNPLSIKRFCEFGIDNWPTTPKHLFLLGKSIRDVTEGTSIGSRNSLSSYQSNLVPSYGYPSSDNHFTVGIGGAGSSFAIATGRYSAMSNSSVIDYLNKVIEYENQQDPLSIYDIPNKEWQKNVLHFGGGSNQAQIALLTSYLGQFEQKIEDTLFGGNVESYFKGTASSLNTSDFFKVQQQLQEGVSLITFFAHATSSGGFGQNIDSPNNWGNSGKYPMVIGLGCYTGDVHQPGGNSYSENMVSPPGEGAISFTSTVKLGYISYLANYTNIYYHMIGKKYYRNDIGSAMKATVDSLATVSTGNILFHSNYSGMSLQGDPALKLNAHLAPEIVLSPDRVWTTPTDIDLSVDSFDLNIVLTNIGSAFVDSFDLTIQRFFPSGSDSTYTVKVSGLYYRDTIRFKMPSYQSIAVGLNNFIIKADLPFSVIGEHYDEINNNQITFSRFISSNDLIPIWPYEYAIIPSDTITCKSSTVNPFAPINQYVFEIDTTDLFNSPFKKQQIITSIGGVVEARPYDWINSNNLAPDPITFTDSTVYFWRCSPDSTTKSWQESSFQYIPNKWGWGQSHFFQFKNNNYTNLLYNRPTRTFDFQASAAQVKCKTFISNGYWPASGWQGTSWYLGGELGEYGGYSTLPAIHIAVIDPVTLQKWETPNYVNGVAVNTQNCFGQFNGHPSLCPGTTNWRGRPEGMFIFQMYNSVQLDSLVSMLNNKIPDGHYILAYTYITDNYNNPANLYASWPSSLFTAFQNLGATSFTPGMADDGFIFFCQKGNPSTVQELHTVDTISGAAGDPEELLAFETFIQGSSTSGIVKGEIVGPAFMWNTLYWNQNPQEANTTDTTRLLIYGIDSVGIETLQIDTLMTTNDSIINLNAIINAATFPTLRIEALTVDTVTITPAQFNRWQVLYQPVPELAVNPKKGFYYTVVNDSLQEGDSLKFGVAIENVSAFDMDSLLVSYWIEDANHTKNHITYPRQDSLKSGEILFDTVSYSSKNLPGVNAIWITANPIVNGNQQDQLEQFYFNNIAQKTFFVREDNTNPILDVTFDGIHILDKDIVSAKPFISITLDDENEFLLLNQDADTSLFDVYLVRPNSSTSEQLFFTDNGNNNFLTWEPATDSKNKFKIEYNPTFTEDGFYTLKVQGRDKSNNYSGDFSYEISFEVITASTITNLFNYPNPFSTKTHFVFTLTGSELPDQLQIQIMTVTGKVVREITLAELGPLHIGNNVTDFYWDGRDQFGDQLANGVYLYRAVVKLNGEKIEQRATSADSKSFKKEFGKMYLMR